MHRKVVFLLVLSLTATSLASDKSSSESGQMSQKETIAVLGTGDMGDSFGPRLAGLGYRVIYGSRTPVNKRVSALVARTGNGASAMKNRDAAENADIVLLAVAERAVERVVKGLGDLDGKVVIDLTWPPTRLAEDGYEESTIVTSRAEQIQTWQASAMVVKAFGTTASYVIDDPDWAGGPVTVPIASDHRRAKEVVARIAAQLDLDPVDAGPLRMARNIEAMMMLYMVPHYQGRQNRWEYYFRRSTYFACNDYTGGEFDDWEGPPPVDIDNLAKFPHTQGEPQPCPNK